MALTIDIEKILKDKMGQKARYVPRFVTAWLRHIIHQDWLNIFLVSHSDVYGSEWLEGVLNYLDVKIKIKGLENLPAKDDGKLYTFVSNHPLGGIDGVAIGAMIGKHYDDNFKYLVNDLLLNLPGLAPLCVGINKTGSNSRSFPQLVEDTFKEQQHVVMFPAGLCSRKIDGVIKDLPWKKTFVTKSIETGRDIVPIYFEGRNSNFFYNLANVCKKLGIKFNIAMLFLVDEMYKNQHNTYTITIGKPISIDSIDKKEKHATIAKHIQESVYKLNDK